MDKVTFYGALTGILTGFSGHLPFLEGKWTNLIVWAAVGMVLGYFATEKKLIVRVGAVYGFFL